MKWLITTHAIERLMGRVDRTITTKQAEDALGTQLPVAVKLDKLTKHGQGYYQIQAFGRPVLVIGKYDAAIRRMVAVSVLRMDEVDTGEDATDEVLAAYERAQKAGALSFVALSNGSMRAGAKVDDLQRRIAALEAHVAVLQLETARAEEERERVALERRLLEKHNAAAVRAATPTPVVHRTTVVVGETVRAKKFERLTIHAAKMEREREAMRPLLRTAVRALTEIAEADGNALAEDALVEIHRTSPDFTLPTFLYPERFTREERRAAGRVAEGAEALTVPA